MQSVVFDFTLEPVKLCRIIDGDMDVDGIQSVAYGDDMEVEAQPVYDIYADGAQPIADNYDDFE
jgi:hypothetical protein